MSVENADAASYQWQSSPDGQSGWTNIAGATAESCKVTAPDSGTWYRCHVSTGGASADSKPVEAIMSNATGDAHGRVWTNT